MSNQPTHKLPSVWPDALIVPPPVKPKFKPDPGALEAIRIMREDGMLITRRAVRAVKLGANLEDTAAVVLADNPPKEYWGNTRYDSCLAGEDAIVWLPEAEGLPYVRQSIDLLPLRANRPPKKYFPRRALLVGYSTVSPETKSERARGGGYLGFWRRVFYLMPHDRGRDRSNPYYYNAAASWEAVDPTTVSPGVCGCMTEHAWWAGAPGDAGLAERYRRDVEG